MLIGSIGSNGEINFTQSASAADSAGDAAKSNSVKQLVDTIGNATGGESYSINTTKVLSDGTIEQLTLLYMLDNKDDSSNKEKTGLALTLAAELYNTISNLNSGAISSSAEAGAGSLGGGGGAAGFGPGAPQAG